MAYTHFDQTLPNPATQTLANVCNSALNNQKALRDMLLLGLLVGWNATPSGGTPFYPAVVTYSKGVERLRRTTTWGSSGGATNNPITIVMEYSANSGSSYDPIGTVSITYNANGSTAGTTWS